MNRQLTFLWTLTSRPFYLMLASLGRLLRKQPPPGEGVFVETLDFDFSNLPPCPYCRSTDVAKMLYGKPALTRQVLEGLETGKIISGGCMIHGGAPEWHCSSCRRDFGHLPLNL